MIVSRVCKRTKMTILTENVIFVAIDDRLQLLNLSNQHICRVIIGSKHSVWVCMLLEEI